MPRTSAADLHDMSTEQLRARAVELRGMFRDLSAGDRNTDEYRAGRQEIISEVEDLDINLDLRTMEAVRTSRSAPAGALGTPQETEYRSPGQQVVDNEEFRSWLKANVGKSQLGNGSPSVEIRALVDGASSSAELLPVGQPYLALPSRRRLFVRDLLTVMSTTLSSVPYVRELNIATNNAGASTVASGAAKPDQTFEFEPDNAPIQVIAAGVILSTQIFDDANLVVQYINGSLTYRLQLREELEILFGNGVTPDLAGIFSSKYAAAVQDQSFTTSIVQTLGNAIGKVETADGYADGIVLAPADFWSLATNRASTSGVLDAGVFSSTPALNVWGLPTVRSNSVTAGTGYVGSWQLGATLFDREQASVRVFEQHAEVASHNQVYLRGEERVGLAVNRPDYFVVADLTA